MFSHQSKINLALAATLALLSGCQPDSKSPEKASPAQAPENTLFTLLPPEKTGVHFANTLTEGPNTNVLVYEYFYNGGGVAVGDVNADGLDDIYFSGNMVANRLYLNQGNMQFRDITTEAGVAGREGPWKTGVTMVDINADGRLDIFVSYSGKLPPDKRRKQLFINEGPDKAGVPRFTEQAAAFGLDNTATSTQASFFDYDRDGDLDMFQLNHSPNSLPVLDEMVTASIIKKSDPDAGVRLFQNNKGKFTDVTDGSGLQSSALSYGLGAGIADINGDNWPDIYVSNDYTIPDYLYLNNKNGTFSDQLKTRIGHTSHFSMGNEVADINNDGLPDIFTLDMLPEDNHRQKLLFAPDNYEKFDLNVRSGFHYQYMRNMLQVNNGNGTHSEIGQLANISNTDWSWAALFADYDNDGWKDLFITNGYLRDYTNLDFIKFMETYVQQLGRRMQRTDVLNLVQQMPSSNVVNYLYRNNKNLTFTKLGKDGGISLPSNSNGAAYSDLDRDGDLDLVVNNINQPAFIYQNESNKKANQHYLQVKLTGTGQNTQGLGAKIWVYTGPHQQFQEQMPTRGYQSSVSPVLHFGLGSEIKADSLVIRWAGGKKQVLQNIKANQVLTLSEQNAHVKLSGMPVLKPVFTSVQAPFTFQHAKTNINDFKRQPLLVNPVSFAGPCLVKADVNGDKREDIFVGGGVGQAGVLYLQNARGQFVPKANPAFLADKESEDTDALFFDANQDKYPDLYVCSGGYGNFMPDDARLQDRLYLNDGQGNFTKSTAALPVMLTSTSCVRATDINQDGFLDLFVAGRVVPGRYPETPRSYLLLNNGKGTFTDQTATLAPMLQKPGLVTDAAWLDLNKDNKPELILVGEWMPIMVLGQVNNRFVTQTNQYFSKPYRGWWNKLLVGDFNQDKNPDLIIGNFGTNSQCKVSTKEPADLYFKDFDDNGSVDPVLCFYMQGQSQPYLTRDELLDQVSMMRTRFPSYKSFADAKLTDIFTPEELKGVGKLTADYLETAYFSLTPGGKFKEQPLPLAAQFAPVFSMLTLDYNQDGFPDLLLAGNINKARLRFGKYDANYGVLLAGDAQGHFRYIPQDQSGFSVKGDVRSLLQVNNTILFGRNQESLIAYKPVNRKK